MFFICDQLVIFDVLVSHFSFGWNLLVIYSRFTLELFEIYVWFTWDLLVAYLRFTCGTKFVICFLEPFCNDLTISFSTVSTSDIYLCFLQAHSCSKSFGEHTGASRIKGLTSGSCSTVSSSSPSTLVVSASFTKGLDQSWGVAFPNPELLPFALALGLDLSSFGVLLLVCTFIALLAGFFILPVLGFGVGVFFGVAPFLGALTLVPASSWESTVWMQLTSSWEPEWHHFHSLSWEWPWESLHFHFVTSVSAPLKLHQPLQLTHKPNWGKNDFLLV